MEDLRKISDQVAEEVVGGEGGPVPADKTCPQCGSKEVRYFGVDPITHLNEYQCSSCAYMWESDD